MKDHDWEHAGVDAETSAPADRLTLLWRCAHCGAACSTTTGTKTITLPRPTAQTALEAKVDPDCDQTIVDQVHDL